MKMRKKHLILISMISLYIVLFTWYSKFPDYKIQNSFDLNIGTERDTSINVVVYKAWWNPCLIDEIIEDFAKVNDYPTSLEINLYYPTQSKNPYRTVKWNFKK